MKTLTIKDIRNYKPCYDPIKYIPENWTGTVIDILNLKDVPVSDRFWVVLRAELVSEKCMRLFAVWCARQVQHLMTDERSIIALDVAEAFANGTAAAEDLDAARAAAGDAAWDAAGDAAGDAAWAAAWDAAARAAAGDAAWAAAWDAAWAVQVSKLKEMIEAENAKDI